MTDPLALFMSWLRTQPEMAGIPVTADLVGHENTSPLVLVESIGGFREVRHRLDRVDLSINSYGPSKQEAANLAYLVRELALERLPAERINNTVIADVQEGTSPQDLSDLESREQRFVHTLSLFIY